MQYKKIILTFYTLTISALGIGQTIDELKKIKEMYKNGEYLNAIPYAFKAKEEALIKFGKQDTTYAATLNYLGLLYSKMSNYEKADSFFSEASTIVKKVLGINHPYYALSLNNLAQLYDEIGNYEKAQTFYIEAIDIYKKTLRTEEANYALLLNNLGQHFLNTGNYEKVEQLFIEASNIYKKTSGVSDPNYLLLLNNLALFYENMGKYDKAEPLFIEALNLNRKILGVSHPNTATMLNNLALHYYHKGEYPKAEPLFIEAQKINKEIYGMETPNYALTLNNLGSLYDEMGKYEKAELFYIEGLNIYKKVLGVEHPSYATPLNNLGLLYFELGKYNKAEPLLLDALHIQKKILGEDHPNYYLSVNNLAELYDQIGDYTKGLQLHLEALQICKRLFGTEHPNYATLLNNLALEYVDLGNYNEAEALYFEALKIRKKVLGSEHPDYGNSLGNFANFYDQLGIYNKAMPMYIEALEIYKKVYGINHPLYASALGDLAGVNEDAGNYKIAEQQYLQALEIEKKVLGAEHPEYATNLSNLAILYDKVGNYKKAEALYNEVINIRKNALGVEHPDYANSLNNLSTFYAARGELKRAELLNIEALNAIKKRLGIDNYDYSLYQQNLATLYIQMESYDKAEILIKKDIESINSMIKKNFAFLSEIEKQYFVNSILYHLEYYYSYLFKRSTLKPILVSTLYNNELQTKGLILRSSNKIKYMLRKSGDSAMAINSQELLQLKKHLAKIYALTKDKYPLNVKELENEAEKLEKALTRESQPYNHYQKEVNSTWIDIQKKLKIDEAAIEFISFHYYSNKWSDSVIYAAFVLRPGYTQPKFVYLFEEKQLSSILKKDEGVLDQAYINQLYQQRESSNPVYKLIWQPLDSLLQGVTTVYAAPAGLLHKIALGAIPVTDSNTVSSKYGLQIVGTTADIINKKEDFINKRSVQQALLFGGINYDIASSKPVDFTSSSTDNIYAYVPTDSSRGATGKWNYLKGAFTEASEINKQFNEQKITTHFYSDSAATETLFKNMPVNKSSVLHIATHGYFFPDIVRKKEDVLQLVDDKKQTAFRVSENPLLRSGLIFAGANPSWTNPDYVSTATDDGILTAYEISNMDLSNVKLVVLSACETGLGDIKGSEGVFGLQRSFKLAGVKNIIMSLWKVPDEKTRELMQYFYQFCFSSKSISEAFNAAQNMMRNKYPDSPYYWAGFTLLQ